MAKTCPVPGKPRPARSTSGLISAPDSWHPQAAVHGGSCLRPTSASGAPFFRRPHSPLFSPWGAAGGAWRASSRSPCTPPRTGSCRPSAAAPQGPSRRGARAGAGAPGRLLTVPRPAPRLAAPRLRTPRPLRHDAGAQRGSRSRRPWSSRWLNAVPRRARDPSPGASRAQRLSSAGQSGQSAQSKRSAAEAPAGGAGHGAPGPPPGGCGCLPGRASREGGSPASGARRWRGRRRRPWRPPATWGPPCWRARPRPRRSTS